MEIGGSQGQVEQCPKCHQMKFMLVTFPSKDAPSVRIRLKVCLSCGYEEEPPEVIM